MSEAKTAIQEHLRLEDKSPDEVTVASLLGKLANHSAIDGPEDVKTALRSIRDSSAAKDSQPDNETVQTLAEADKEPFKEVITTIEDTALLRAYTEYEVKTKTRKDRIAITNQRIGEIQNAAEDSPEGG